MIPFRERLKQPDVIIADGAMGTMLFQRGLKSGNCPERINLEKPELLEEIAQLYLNAGAEIIQTNTFGGSPLKLAAYSLGTKTEEINANAVRAVRKIGGTNAYVAASCGPSGKLLEPFGDTNADVMFDSFKRQIRVLIEEGADLICIETMSDLNEASLAVKAARSCSSTIPICATMTFDVTPKGIFTIMGVTVQQAVEGLVKAGADIVGSNCGNGIKNMLKIADEFIKYSPLPVGIRSNAGLPELKDGTAYFPETPKFMSEWSMELKKMGVKIIGGCCGTTPEHIAAIKKRVEN